MNFFNENFLLKNEAAVKLYHEYAKDMPIFDFHCHLEPKLIYENPKFESITEAWLAGDHYKWRLMRASGISEEFVTGSASELDKFKAFAKTLELCIGSPVYHWAHMELQLYFGINEPLTEKNAEDIFYKTNEKLKQKGYRLRNFIEKSNVKIIYTTDDPIDDLEYHKLIKSDSSINFKVLPAFRPDRAINIENAGFADYIKSLGQVSKLEISNLESLKNALKNRVEYFNSVGCKASDHGITHIPYAEASLEEVDGIFKLALGGGNLSKLEQDKFKTAIFEYLAKLYTELDWAMELHFGIIRNINMPMMEKIGENTGYDCIGDYPVAENLAKLIAKIHSANNLPKTILFNANPADNALISTVIGAFQESKGIKKMQFGTPWWFNDTLYGMQAQIRQLADTSVLGKFIGMLTDSRSFLSYPRHLYFRRILCNIIGEWITEGSYNPDLTAAGKIIQDICYNNAVEYFGM